MCCFSLAGITHGSLSGITHVFVFLFQELHMCLDGKIWKWCEPIDLDTIGTLIRVVKTIDRQYTVIIQIKQLSNAQKQVNIQIRKHWKLNCSCHDMAEKLLN